MTPTPVRIAVAAAALTVAGAGVSVLAIQGSDAAARPAARTVLRDAAGDDVGRVRIVAIDDHVRLTVELKVNPHVAPAQFHGIHIHANDDPTNGEGCVADAAQPSNTWFASADGHLEVGNQTHGDHLGDLPSLLVNADGTATSVFTDDDLVPGDLAGKVLVVHAGPDNFGNVPTGPGADQYTANSPAATSKTQNTGNAGDRVACGVLTR